MHAMFNKEKINRWTVNDIAGVTYRRHEEENILQKRNLNDMLDVTCSVVGVAVDRTIMRLE